MLVRKCRCNVQTGMRACTHEQAVGITGSSSQRAASSVHACWDRPASATSARLSSKRCTGGAALAPAQPRAHLHQQAPQICSRDRGSDGEVQRASQGELASNHLTLPPSRARTSPCAPPVARLAAVPASAGTTGELPRQMARRRGPALESARTGRRSSHGLARYGSAATPPKSLA